MHICKIFRLLTFFFFVSLHSEEQRNFPLYEDYLKDSDFSGYLRTAREFLEKNSDVPEAPRLAYDFMMVGLSLIHI